MQYLETAELKENWRREENTKVLQIETERLRQKSASGAPPTLKSHHQPFPKDKFEQLTSGNGIFKVIKQKHLPFPDPWERLG